MTGYTITIGYLDIPGSAQFVFESFATYQDALDLVNACLQRDREQGDTAQEYQILAPDGHVVHTESVGHPSTPAV